jgi:hypothetical protein
LPCASISRRSGKQAAAVTKVRLSALRLPSKRGEKDKSQTRAGARDEAAWLFEIRIQKFSQDADAYSAVVPGRCQQAAAITRPTISIGGYGPGVRRDDAGEGF